MCKYVRKYIFIGLYIDVDVYISICVTTTYMCKERNILRHGDRIEICVFICIYLCMFIYTYLYVQQQHVYAKNQN